MENYPTNRKSLVNEGTTWTVPRVDSLRGKFHLGYQPTQNLKHSPEGPKKSEMMTQENGNFVTDGSTPLGGK